MSKKNRRLFIGCTSVTIVALIGLVVGYFFLWDGITPVSEILPPYSTPISLSISNPENNTSWPADAYIPIRVIAMSEGKITSLELWADGVLVETQNPTTEPNRIYVSTLWRWMPVVAGDHSLVVRAKNSTNQVSTSNIVHLTATEPVGFSMLYPVVQNETIDEVAIHFEIPSEELIEQNPSLDEDNPIPEGALISVPVPSVPLSDSEIPSPTAPPDEVAQTAEEMLPISLSVWLENLFVGIDNAPLAPELAASTDGCTVNLFFTDKSADEAGFFIYKADSGSTAFQRIDLLSANDSAQPLQYSESNQKGSLQYYISAFNGAGETPSNPVHIHFTDPACQSSSIIGLELNEENLILPVVVDLAYFYISVNNGPYDRFPSQPDSFFSPEDQKISIKTFLDFLVALSPTPVNTISLEAWGWQGESLIELGTLNTTFDHTDLKICNLGTGCTGDAASGFRSAYGEVASDSENQVHEFYWHTNAPETTGALWQISTSPFPEGFQPHPQNLVAAGCVEGTRGGSFTVDFGDLKQYQPAPTSCGEGGMPFLQYAPYSLWNVLNQDALPLTYYTRIIPMNGNQPAAQPSNIVVINYGPSDPTIEPVVLDHLPNLYQIEIVSFELIDRADPTYWGCVYIESLDFETIAAAMPEGIGVSKEQLAHMIYDPLTEAMNNGWAVCPSPHQKSEPSIWEEWGTMFVGGLEELWNTVVHTFESLKNEIVKGVAEIINTLGFECGEDCKEKLMTGLEIGIAYFTGIPPSLPEFDDLADMGVDYAIELAVAEAGVPCPDECKQLLKDGLEPIVESVKQSKSQPGCISSGVAEVLGKYPLCLPPGVETRAVPEGVIHPAIAAVKVTRPLEGPPGEYKYDDRPAYAVNLAVTASNPKLSGKTLNYYYEYSVLNPVEIVGLPIGYTTETGWFYLNVPIEAEIRGRVFKSQTIPIPLIQPGTSITIPVVLQPIDVVLLEHSLALSAELNSRGLTFDDVGGFAGSPGFLHDWGCLYNSGLIKIEAEVTCLSVPTGLIGTTEPGPDSTLVSCGAEALPWVVWETNDTCVP